ncbi:UDP-N-acetylglucosamine transporter TMEM241 homolog isoform X2 [Acropora palmata]|uniref:UDP-N-acetylglucosamine transporter TMEM241 homolog isoform X2 n=1 Tax=Acropora palmata TaxID=6131 RepID=UPI003DA04532
MVSTWRTRVVLVGFCCFAVITIFVNKHVLSNLHFTYPTIFQSWQTGTAALVILSMSTLGYTNLNVMSVNRTVLVSWLPASVLFSAMIYSGSVALSRLPVPVFCAIHYISIIVQILLESLLFKKKSEYPWIVQVTGANQNARKLLSTDLDLPINSQFSLIVTALAVVMVAATDTQVILSLFLFFFYCVCVFLFVFSFFFFLQFDQIGYKWMMIHCTFSAAYVLYGNSLRKNSLSDLNKMFCNAVTSVILLMTISVTTGELFRLIEFPYLYSSSFHLWCMTSGLCGTALSVCHGFLLGTDLSHSIAKITSFNRVAISLLSLFIFDMSPSANMAVRFVSYKFTKLHCSGSFQWSITFLQ